MLTAKLKLVWTPFTDDGEHAMLGDIVIASITPISSDPGTWAYSVDGVSMKWIGRGRGLVQGKASAKRAVERAWASWLAQAGLDCGS